MDGEQVSFLAGILSENVSTAIAQALAPLTTPAAIYRPVVRQVEPGRYAAISRDDTSICGYGASPAEACEAFNQVWNGSRTTS